MTKVPLPPDHNDTEECFKRQETRDQYYSATGWDHVEKMVAIVGIVLGVLFLAACIWLKYF